MTTPFYPVDSLVWFFVADPFWATLIFASVAFVFSAIKHNSRLTLALEAEVAALSQQVQEAREGEAALRSELAQAVAFRRRVRALNQETAEEGQAYADTAETTVERYREAVEDLTAERDQLLVEEEQWVAVAAELQDHQEALAAAHTALAQQVRDDAERAADALAECFRDHETEAVALLARRESLQAENDSLTAAAAQLWRDVDTLTVEVQQLSDAASVAQSTEPEADPRSIIDAKPMRSSMSVESQEAPPTMASSPNRVAPLGEGESVVDATVSESVATAAKAEPTVLAVLGNATNRIATASAKPHIHIVEKKSAGKGMAQPSPKPNNKNKRRHRRALVKIVGKENF